MIEESFSSKVEDACNTENIDIVLHDQINKGFVKEKVNVLGWTRIDEFKKLLAKHKYQNRIQWSDIKLFCGMKELLPNHRRLFDLEVESGSEIAIKYGSSLEYDQKGVIHSYNLFEDENPEIQNLLLEVQSGLDHGRKPTMTESGISGSYYIQNHSSKTIAIFKPYDEEPFATNNPKLYRGVTGTKGIRRGILSGESAFREVAAYLLDSEKFHDVPETTFVEFFHPSFERKSQEEILKVSVFCTEVLEEQNWLKIKNGSLQRFVEAETIGSFNVNEISVDQVHKIGILDLRILNCDRNKANILVKKVPTKDSKTDLKLIPIGHGLSLLGNFEICMEEMVWMKYSQSCLPFSQKSLDFIQDIDPIRDCEILKGKLEFREICLRNLRIAVTFLKRMASQGYTLKEIGEMFYRIEDQSEYLDSEEEDCKYDSLSRSQKMNFSALELIVSQAEKRYFLLKENGLKPSLKKREKKKESVKVKKNKNKKNKSLPQLMISSKQKKENKTANNQQDCDENFKEEAEKMWDERFFELFESFLEDFVEEKKRKVFFHKTMNLERKYGKSIHQV